MNMYKRFRAATLLLCSLTALFLVVTDVAEAQRRGGSFGGSRGGSRGGSFRSTPRSSSPSPTYRPRTGSGSSPSTTTRSRSSFGGTRLSSSQDYTKSYGVPRRSERITSTQGGVPQNYVVHSYGGRGDGFMMGYLAGSTSWMWSMPFHPAFYYSRPYYVQNPDGTVGVYPPTFSWGTLIMTVVVVGGIAYIVYRVVKRRRNASYSAAQSSFS